MKHLLKIAIAAAVACIVASCASVRLNLPANLTFESFGTYLDDTIPRLVNERLPGIQIALIEGGELVYEKGFGLADKKLSAPLTSETIFQVASVSKTVTAWAVLALAQGQKIDLDQPISAYVHRWTLPQSKYDAQGVTVRNILAHRAGLSLHGYPGYAPGERMPTIEQSLSGDNGTFFGFYKPGPVKLVRTPGSAFSYSGGGYTLLQLMIEEVSGEGFSDFVRKTVLLPARMSSSSFEYTPDVERRVSKAYSMTGSLLPNYLFVEKAAAGLYTTAHDLARLLNELYRIKTDATYNSALLSQKCASLFYLDNPGVSEGRDAFGYLRTRENGQIAIVEHDGANQGWRCFYALELSGGKGMVLLANSDAGQDVVSKFLGVYKDLVRRKSS